MNDELRWLSATEQRRLLDAGEVTAAELHALAVASIERLDPTLHAVVSPLFDRDASGVPIVLKDACQELAGELGTLVGPWSFTRQPAVSVPVHWTAAGLPIGTQLVGRRGEDAVLLQLAVALQDAADWRWRRPAVS